MVSQSPDLSQSVDALNILSAFPSQKFKEILAVQKLAGDASTREYFRIACDDLKNTYILQRAEPFAGVAPSKHPFWAARDLLAIAGIAVPTIVAANPERGWLLQQDLGDETLQTSGCLDLYNEAVDNSILMAKHIRANNAKLGQLAQDAPQFKWAFDFEKLNWEMNFTADHLVKKLMGANGAAFLKSTEHNTRFLDQRPRFFAHRDYHSRNLMVSNGKLYTIDFQDGRMGPLTYDAASLIWDPYVQLDSKTQQKLWDRFVDGARTQIPEVFANGGERTLEEEKYRMIVQRMLKAAGSYASFYNVQKRNSYLPSIAPAIENALWALRQIQANGLAQPADAQLLTQVTAIAQSVPAILKSSS